MKDDSKKFEYKVGLIVVQPLSLLYKIDMIVLFKKSIK